MRADVTYLKQDFSVALDVPDAHPWPTSQRFDFLVRTRAAGSRDADKGLEFPQRDAILRALRVLTGRDAGKSTADWQQVAEEEKAIREDS